MAAQGILGGILAFIQLIALTVLAFAAGQEWELWHIAGLAAVVLISALQIMSRMKVIVRSHNQKEMDKLDRIHLVGEMAAGIGHEIRNPLTTVRGLLQLMTMKEESGHSRDKYQLMIEEIDHANSIITKFLLMAKNKNVVLQECRLNDIVYSVLPLIEAEAILERKLVSVSLASHKPIFADTKEIQQLLLNLTVNSLEAMQPGEVLGIETFDAADKILLVIRDTGKGIPQHVLEKLGTPFVTTKEQGAGLGLPVCYSIAARHRADFTVETSHKGTSFFVSFPQARSITDWPEPDKGKES